jgi:biotin transport system substrate-specific component
VNSPRTRRRTAADLALVAVFAALIAASSLLSIPMPPVPFTMQTFGVLLAGATLGATRGLLAVLLFLALGAIGLPVFAGGGAGLAVFAGPTVGYLAGFPLAAWATGVVVERLPRRATGSRTTVARTVLIAVTAFAATVVVIYVLGIPGFAWRGNTTMSAAFVVNLRFVPGDIAKAVLVAIVATAVHRAFPDLLPPPRRARLADTGAAVPTS